MSKKQPQVTRESPSGAVAEQVLGGWLAKLYDQSDEAASLHALQKLGLLMAGPLDGHDPELVKESMQALTQRLGDEKATVRKEAYRGLMKIKAKVVAPYAGTILSFVCDDNSDVRLPAFQLLVKLCLTPVQLAPLAIVVIERLLEDNNDVQLRACKLLVKLKFSPEALQPHAGLIASQMADDHPEVCLHAYHFLLLISAEGLGPFVADIAQWLDVEAPSSGPSDIARLRCIHLLLRVRPKLVGPYISKILERFLQDTDEIRQEAFSLLQKVRREDLGQYAAVFVEQMADESAERRLRAFQLLLRLSPEALEPHARVILQQIGGDTEARWKAYRLTYKALSATDLRLPPEMTPKVATQQAIENANKHLPSLVDTAMYLPSASASAGRREMAIARNAAKALAASA